MRENTFFSRILTLAGIFLFLSPVATFAASSMVSQDLYNQGKLYYDRGDYQRAIHEVSKALLVDPKNEEAAAFLKKFGIKESLYGRQNPPIAQVAKLAENIDKYQQKVSRLQAENQQKDQLAQSLVEEKESLRQIAFAKEIESQQFRQKAAEIQKNADVQAVLSKKGISELAASVKKKTSDVVRLNTDIYQAKNDLVQKLAVLQEKDQRLKELEVFRSATDRQRRGDQLEYQAQIQALERQFDIYKEETQTAMAEQVNSIDDLKTALRQKKIELGYAGDKILFTDYKLMNSESETLQKTSKIHALEQSLSDLEKEVAYWQAKIGARGAEQGFQAAATTKDHQENIQWIKKQDQLIADLKAELTLARQEIASLKKGGGEENTERIAALTDQLTQMRMDLKQKEAALEQKDSENGILAQRLDDTQQRLQLVEKMIEDKESQIKELEQQLTDALGQE